MFEWQKLCKNELWCSVRILFLFSSFFPSSFFDFKTRFYLFIVRFFLRKQYSGCSVFSPVALRKSWKHAQVFVNLRHTVRIFRGRRKVLLGRVGKKHLKCALHRWQESVWNAIVCWSREALTEHAGPEGDEEDVSKVNAVCVSRMCLLFSLPEIYSKRGWRRLTPKTAQTKLTKWTKKTSGVLLF